MSLAYVNTLEYVKLLMQAKFTQEQAEALNKAQMLATQAVISQVATQAEMQSEFMIVRYEIQTEFKNHRSEVQADFEKFRFEMQADFVEFRSEMQYEFAKFRSEVQADMMKLEDRLRHEIKDVEQRLEKAIFKSIIYGMGINFVMMGLGVGALAFFLQ